MSQNRSVLLLKAPKEQQADPYVEVLGSAGFQASCVPALEFSFINLDKLRFALQSCDKYSCLILSSPRAAEAICNAFSTSTLTTEWEDLLSHSWAAKHSFVVGQATAAAATDLGLKPVGAESGSAANLATLIVGELRRHSLTEQPALFPCGQLSLETLPTSLQGQGIAVESLTVYETVANKSLADNLKTFVDVQGYPHYIVFFSPSIVTFSHNILEDLGFLHSRVQLIAIGPTTEAAMESTFGVISGTAIRPTPQDVCDLIQHLHSAALLDSSHVNN